MNFSLSKIQKQQHYKPNLIRTFLLNIISGCGFLIGISFFAVYRKVIDLYLKQKIGYYYGGLIAPEDMVFCVPTVSKCCITSVFYVKCDKDTKVLERVREIMQKKIFDHPENYPKLTSTMHQFGGYYYTKKSQCNINDIIRPIKVKKGRKLDEEYLKQCTGEVTNAEFAKDGTMLWEIHVALNPIIEKSHEAYTYPVVIRIHHVVADGTSLVSLLIQMWGDESCENYLKNIFKKFRNPFENKQEYNTWSEWIVLKTGNFIKKMLLYLEMLFLSFGRVMEMNLLKPNNINALHEGKITGDKICAWVVEDKIECIPLVKGIKNREKTNFDCVMATALAASLSNYFKRNDFPIPEYVTEIISFMPSYPEENRSTPIILRNRSGALIFDLPLIHGLTRLPEALQNISKEWKKQLKISDALLTTFLLQHIGYIPVQILRRCFGWTSQTMFSSNVPGGSIIQTCDGWVVENIIPIPPNAQGIGVSFAIFSYDDRLHIGVLVDSGLVKSQEEVQKMADDIPFYIKLLDIQTKEGR